MTVRAPWRTNEDRTMHALYANGGAYAVQAVHPHRTILAIRYRAYTLGIKATGMRREWSFTEIRMLRANIRSLGVRGVAKMLGRSRGSVYWKAQELGIRSPKAKRRTKVTTK